MSTLKATNIKNPDSGSNNIVLSESGGVVISGVTTITTLNASKITGVSGGMVVSGVTTVSAGSTSAPSITPSGDENTGIFFPSADTIAFGEGGSEAARFDSSGRLLVGTTSSITVDGVVNSKSQIEHTNYDASLTIKRNQANAGGATIFLGKSRGTANGSNTIVNNGDAVGLIRFFGADGSDLKECAAINAEIDNTPDANDMPGRLVFSTTADSASSPSERLRISNTGALGLSGANYGTSGQVLTSQGSGSAPQWADAGGGAWNFISSVTASNSSSVAFTSGIDSTYDVYVIIGIGIIPTQDSKLLSRTSSNSGSSYDSGSGDYSTSSYNQDLTVGSLTSFEPTGNIESTSSSGCDFEFYLYNPSNATRRKYARSHSFRQTPTAGTWNNEAQAHMRHSTSAINAIQFLMAAGNINSGTFRLYGISNS